MNHVDLDNAREALALVRHGHMPCVGETRAQFRARCDAVDAANVGFARAIADGPWPGLTYQETAREWVSSFDLPAVSLDALTLAALGGHLDDGPCRASVAQRQAAFRVAAEAAAAAHPARVPRDPTRLTCQEAALVRLPVFVRDPYLVVDDVCAAARRSPPVGWLTRLDRLARRAREPGALAPEAHDDYRLRVLAAHRRCRRREAAGVDVAPGGARLLCRSCGMRGCKVCEPRRRRASVQSTLLLPGWAHGECRCLRCQPGRGIGRLYLVTLTPDRRPRHPEELRAFLAAARNALATLPNVTGVRVVVEATPRDAGYEHRGRFWREFHWHIHAVVQTLDVWDYRQVRAALAPVAGIGTGRGLDFRLLHWHAGGPAALVRYLGKYMSKGLSEEGRESVAVDWAAWTRGMRLTWSTGTAFGARVDVTDVARSVRMEAMPGVVPVASPTPRGRMPVAVLRRGARATLRERARLALQQSVASAPSGFSLGNGAEVVTTAFTARFTGREQVRVRQLLEQWAALVPVADVGLPRRTSLPGWFHQLESGAARPDRQAWLTVYVEDDILDASTGQRGGRVPSPPHPASAPLPLFTLS